jgi:nicotinamidase-related amidase
VLLRAFSNPGLDSFYRNGSPPTSETLGDEIGPVTLWDGQVVQGGRRLMRDQWNSDLYESLRRELVKSQNTPKPDVRFYKDRISGFWNGDAPIAKYLREHGITTLLFGGVNTDQCVFASLQDACNMGFDTILLKDGCGTTSPEFASRMVEFNCQRSFGFVTTCDDFARGASSMLTGDS